MTATITCTGCKHGYAETALFCPNCGRPKVRETTGDSLVGKVLGERFQVLSLLGQGGSGTIYRAEHTTLRRKVAIKVLHNELSRDDLAVERFRREATTVADIDNEHIVEIHDFGRTPDGRLYLAMELLEGETLDAVIEREKQLSVERAADILIQVGEALMEAHAIGYVHRDLRPRNIYLTTRRAKQNFVKLLDFGLAKLVEPDSGVKDAEATSLGMTFGDPRYMSPEQARGDRIDLRADIYQLGCVAYEMLTGGPPFTGARVFDILTKQVTESPAPLPVKRPGTPLWMEAAIAKMLAKDPENRFATTSRMVEALRRGLETGEVMEDVIARRRESVPPPSVSRVMQKMGISPELPPHAAAAAAAESAKPKVELAAEVSESRRSTGTPKVGVPVVKAPTDAPGRVQTGMVAAGPTPSRSKRESAGISSTSRSSARAPSHNDDDDRNLSQVWYDEGDERKPTGTFSDLGDSMYDVPARGRRWGLIIGVIGAVVVIGTVAFALTRGEKTTKKVDEVATNPPPATDVAPSQILGEDAGVAAIPDAGAMVQTPTPGKKTNTGTGTPRPNNTVTSRPNPITNNSGFSPPGTPSGFTPPGTPSGFTPPGTPSGFTPPGTSPGYFPPATPGGPPIVTTPPKPPGLTDNPEDPYGPPDEPPPSESGSSETKAAFFANLGTQQLGSGDTASAAASFKKAIELDGKNVTAMIGMGEIALRQGLFGDAIAHLKKAARLARSARVYTLLGEAYLNSGNNAEAARNFKAALQIDPDNARARDGYNEASSRVPAEE
ncbi:MAG: protein kinase domain-containing protein [Kofleriaceae bacterium]